MRKSRSRLPIQRAHIVFVVACVCALLLLRWSVGQYSTYQRAQELYIDAAAQEIRASDRLGILEQRNALLGTEIGKQDILIDQYAVKRPGERVLILVRDTQEQAPQEQEKKPTWWEKIQGVFK